MKKVIIIGAGFGGLVAAAELARGGADVTLLEAHTYPGGCAGTFFYQNYRFDAGATLAGGFAPGMPMDLIARRFDIDWQPVFSQSAMSVHLPENNLIHLWTDREKWKQERSSFFDATTESFWNWQETTAETLWDFALKLPPWPPQRPQDVYNLARLGLTKNRMKAHILLDAFTTLSSKIKKGNELFRLFIDGQLLISSQTTSQFANALYAASALDLAHRGVVHVPDGIGGMAKKLSNRVQQLGGIVRFRHQVSRVQPQPDRTYLVQMKTGEQFKGDVVIFNLPPWNINQLLGKDSPSSIQKRTRRKPEGWGAFTVYLGVDSQYIPETSDLHHQVIAHRPLGEGNSIFISLSPPWDTRRAPSGKRAITISTHSRMTPWWELYNNDSDAYEKRKSEYTQKVLHLAEQVFPKLSQSSELILPGTPVTFQRFTHRVDGWVGGFPQTNLFRSWGPSLGNNLWMVGDSIFPGQSVAAVALGGLRVGMEVLRCL